MRRFSVSSRRDVKGLIEGAVGGPDAQGGVEDQQRLAHRIHDVLGVGFDGLQVRLGAPPFGHVFHGQHQQLPVMARLKLAGVEQHHPPSDDREVMLPLKIVEDRTQGNNIFKEVSQDRDIPLAVAQFVNQAVLGFFERDLKSLVEGAIRGSHAQRGVKNQERLAHRIHDVLGVRFDGLQVRLRAPPLRHIFHGQHQEFGVAARAQLATVEQHHAAPDDREGVL